jgi:1,4-alpha-glucan branching enzyme
MFIDEWSRESHPMTKDAFGVFEIIIPAKNGQPAIAHMSKLKVSILRVDAFD